MGEQNYQKLNWGTFLVKNSYGKENKFYSKGYISQTFGLSKAEIEQYLSLNLKVLKLIENELGKEVLKEYHLIKASEVEQYTEFRNKHKSEFRKL